MKKLHLGLLATAAVMAVSTSALAEGPYLSFGGGLSFPQGSNVDIRQPPTGVAVNAKTTFDTGFIVSSALGYKWAAGPRTEFELNYRTSGLDEMAGADATGRQKVFGVMGNLLYDFATNGSYCP